MKNPQEIVVMKEDETETVEDVDTWWYDGLDLIVLYTNGQTETFSGATVSN